MNKDYAYYKRVADCAQDLFDNRLGWSEGRNPYAPKEIWLKLEKALYKLDQPDSHVVTSPDERRAEEPQAEDDLVKAAKDYETMLQTRGVSDKELKEARVRIAQAIEVKIEELQDDYNSLCEAEQDHAKRFAGIEDSWLKTEIEGCVKHDPDMLEQVTTWRKEIERKVEELERKHGWCDTLHTHPVKPKPQPKGGVATDKNGHPLIPGVSVIHYKSPNCEWYGLFHRRENNYFYYYGITTHEPARFSEDVWCSEPQYFTWLRDLDFPGGDK